MRLNAATNLPQKPATLTYLPKGSRCTRRGGPGRYVVAAMREQGLLATLLDQLALLLVPRPPRARPRTLVGSFHGDALEGSILRYGWC